MSIIDQLSTDFSHAVQNRGRQYFQQRTVRISHSDEWSIEATVQGTNLYDVSITWDNEAIEYDCTCEFFTSNSEPCKHLFATLLTAEAEGLLPDRIVRAADENYDDDEDEPVIQVGFGNDVRLMRPPPLGRPVGDKPRHAIWRRRLGELKSALQTGTTMRPDPWPETRQIVYIIDASSHGHVLPALTVELATRMAKKSGGWERVKQLRMSRRQIPTLPDAADRDIIPMLAGMGNGLSSYYYNDEVPRQYRISDTAQESLIKSLCRTGRCLFRLDPQDANPRPLTWDDDIPWELVLRVASHEGNNYKLDAVLRRGERQIDISKASLIVPGGLVFIDHTVARLNDGGAPAIAAQFRHDQNILIPAEQGDELLSELTSMPRLPRLDLPEALQVTEVRQSPRPRLRMRAPRKGANDTRLSGEVSFQYEDQTIEAGNQAAVIFQRDHRRVIHRDIPTEEAALAKLRDVGFRPEYDYSVNATVFRLSTKHLAQAVRTLIEEHWRVEIDGKIYRQPSKIKIEVSSGIDWFELHGSADFGESQIALPKLLRSISKGETTVVLDDGTVGILPEEWLKQYGLLGAMGTQKDDTIQFSKSQVGLLDALLAAQPLVQVDETFARAREQLLRFQGVAAANPPASFVGELRPYQCDGLGWLNFLRNFGLNGCLADDMGLGKTVQVLALLDHRRILRNTAGEFPDKPVGPSLVVVPRSLVFNWVQEARRFAPQLKVLDHASVDRLKTIDHFTEFDFILTTYGTLRNDAAVLRDLRFDYVILDEAQAIKNASSETAKAARLLLSNHRLVLSGTPVQNHLGELWSLFEFLNPGMLGASRAFNMANGGANSRTLDEDNRLLLSRALKPFILRRTKEQVAKDLPEKVEQTIFCELDKAQRALYDELREHYRQSLMTRIEAEGINKSKIQVLEALLRLRQAACHPGLLDKTRLDEGSAKLDTLLPRLSEVAREGHKAIVFSQFTSFLSIVRKKLDEEGVIYEYLDGKTRDRQQRVERFQNDENCKLFIISLKAGGVGLNLTAAQYVFLLDPWWNPAIESQAIDRAHRIGQSKNVFAYRLIAKDTVEEKVLQLQQTKRDLADAIIKADNNLIAKLGREELELLLS